MECLVEPCECQAQMDKLKCLADDTSNPHSPIQPSTNISCNDTANDVTNFSRFPVYDSANVTAHDLNTPGVCAMPSIDINKLLEVIGKLADNEKNLQEMLREEKILNRIFQNTIERLKDDNNNMAIRIRERETTIESQKDASIKCADHGARSCKSNANHIHRPQEDTKIKIHTDAGLTVEQQWNICVVERRKKFEQYQMGLKAAEYQNENKFPEAKKRKQHKVEIKESSEKVRSLKETTTNESNRRDPNKVMQRTRSNTSNSESVPNEIQKKVTQKWKGGLYSLMVTAC